MQFELKAVLEHMQIKVTDADVFQMISEVDEDNSGAIGLYYSLTLIFFCPMEGASALSLFVVSYKKKK